MRRSKLIEPVFYSERDSLEWQQADLDKLTLNALENLPVSWSKGEDGKIYVLSRFGEDTWQYPYSRFPNSTKASQRKIEFSKSPTCFRTAFKEVIRKYDLAENPSGATLITHAISICTFLDYVYSLGIEEPSEITSLHCANYVKYSRAQTGLKDKTLSKSQLTKRFFAVELLYRYLKGTDHEFTHPWPDSSSTYLAGYIQRGPYIAKTKIIPEAALCDLFRVSVDYLDRAEKMLVLRDHLEEMQNEFKRNNKSWRINNEAITNMLHNHGYDGTSKKLQSELMNLQTACMVVILTLSGIRLHELSSLEREPWFRTLDDEGEATYWMRGRSQKTHEGDCVWLIPEVVTRALNVAQYYAEPMRGTLREQMDSLRESRSDVAELHALEHIQDSLFLVIVKRKINQIGCLSGNGIFKRINNYAKEHGIEVHLAPHMFRRTFAVYAAKSAYGDLRYLREHFKHWSLDMTLLYAMNDKQDSELYDEIMVAMIDEKITRVTHWLDGETLLSGGGAEQIRTFRLKLEAVTTYEDRRAMAERISDQIFLRATGSAWCTADTGGCAGRGVVENTRCASCDNGVIDDCNSTTWKGIYAQQLELRNIPDIGEAGRVRVERDIARCEGVLEDLGLLEACKQAVEGG